jgi:hypothetical protein
LAAPHNSGAVLARRLTIRSAEPAEGGVEGEPAPPPLPLSASLAGQTPGARFALQLRAMLTVPFLKHFVAEHDSSSSNTSGVRVIRRM